MAEFEFLINNNYAKRTLSEHPSDDVAAVCALQDKFEHLTWSGTIELALAKRLLKHENNHIACFFGRGAYRKVGAFSWEHPEDGRSLIGLVSKNSVMAIVKNGVPYIYTNGDLPELRERIIEANDTIEKPKSNLVSLASFKSPSL